MGVQAAQGGSRHDAVWIRPGCYRNRRRAEATSGQVLPGPCNRHTGATRSNVHTKRVSATLRARAQCSSAGTSAHD
jgi:hypothetical protein